MSLSRLLSKGDGSYEEQELEWQMSLMQEMNRKVENAVSHQLGESTWVHQSF
jgi:hypothetical protein